MLHLRSLRPINVINNNNNNNITFLLGAPLTQGPALDQAWSERCNDLTRALERLKLIASQDALILLRASFSAPRGQHLLRCSPSVSHAALDSFDELLRTGLSYLTNCDRSDSEWIQAI